ncbi:winged helix-turn-helix transcriptional regulator [Nonomuraea sp. NPDC050556]|uniref:winged helix-turn-helix transcriptional regulator n=1 Tax=Nonomuraea sp. NPDC050556 TaxID=3364369 RepID=UPI0037B212F7
MATMSAADRRAQAKLVYDAYIDECPSRKLLDTLSDKWVTLILNALSGGQRRYSDLARAIAGVSQKMLTQTLRRLERDGLVTRAVTPSVPVRVDYELTALGVSLLPVVAAIKGWAEAHIEDVEDARGRYDAASRT